MQFKEMFANRLGWRRRLISGMALSAVAAAGVGAVFAPEPAQALCRRGAFTLFGGIDRELVLPHRICNNEPRSGNAIYQLEVPGERINAAVLEIEVSYDPIFTQPFRGGRFNIDAIEIIGEEGDRIAVEEIIWDQDASRVEIYPEEIIPANSDFAIHFNDVYNPSRYQQNIFTLKVLQQGESLRRIIGAWTLEISAGD